MGSDGWDFEKLSLGWLSGSTADVQLFVGGGSAPVDFTQLCFTTAGCGGNGPLNSVSNGFEQLGVLSFTGQGTKDITTNKTGRYLVVSGALDQKDDFFKVSGFAATRMPEPGALLLLGMGAFAMWGVGRRRMKTV